MSDKKNIVKVKVSVGESSFPVSNFDKALGMVGLQQLLMERAEVSEPINGIIIVSGKKRKIVDINMVEFSDLQNNDELLITVGTQDPSLNEITIVHKKANKSTLLAFNNLTLAAIADESKSKLGVQEIGVIQDINGGLIYTPTKPIDINRIFPGDKIFVFTKGEPLLSIDDAIPLLMGDNNNIIDPILKYKSDNESVSFLAWNIAQNKVTPDKAKLKLICDILVSFDISCLLEFYNSTEHMNIMKKSLPNFGYKAAKNNKGEKVTFFINTQNILINSNESRECFDIHNKFINYPAIIGLQSKHTGWPFIAVGVHIKAKGNHGEAIETANEISLLSKITNNINGQIGEIDIIIAGDFNLHPEESKLAFETFATVSALNTTKAIQTMQHQIKESTMIRSNFKNDNILISTGVKVLKSGVLKYIPVVELGKFIISSESNELLGKSRDITDHWGVAALFDAKTRAKFPVDWSKFIDK